MKLTILLFAVTVAFGQSIQSGQVQSDPPMVFGGGPNWKPSTPSYKPWLLSIGALVGAEAFDAVSSRGLYEMNPILGRGPFGERQTEVKFGILAGFMLGEWLAVRHHPDRARMFKWLNYGGAVVTVGGAIHNEAIR